MQLKISEVEFAHDLNVEHPYLAMEQPATEHVDIWHHARTEARIRDCA